MIHVQQEFYKFRGLACKVLVEYFKNIPQKPRDCGSTESVGGLERRDKKWHQSIAFPDFQFDHLPFRWPSLHKARHGKMASASGLGFRQQNRCLPLRRIPFFAASLRRYKHDSSPSAKLFEDAKREEHEEKQAIERRQQTTNALLTRQADRNWDGEEPIADAVLRMLVDKYKPLRSGTILSADEKLSKAAPTVRTGDIPSSSSPSSLESTREESFTALNRPLAYPKVDLSKPLKDQPLLPAVEGHRPWHTNFTAPSHATASIRLGNLKPVKPGSSPVLDEKAKKLEKENKRFQTAFRLEGAKESVLEHRLGVGRQRRVQANPLTMKGWANLVEQRIEVRSAYVS